MAYILVEQIRYADKARFFEQEGSLSDYDRAHLDLHLKFVLGIA
jgi:mRNA-degrading endonuclease toxin of MazEF toxin-antitoxin module